MLYKNTTKLDFMIMIKLKVFLNVCEREFTRSLILFFCCCHLTLTFAVVNENQPLKINNENVTFQLKFNNNYESSYYTL